MNTNQNHNNAAEANGNGKTPLSRNYSRERLYIIGNLIVNEAWQRLEQAKKSGNFHVLYDMQHILDDALEQLGNCLLIADRLDPKSKRNMEENN